MPVEIPVSQPRRFRGSAYFRARRRHIIKLLFYYGMSPAKIAGIYGMTCQQVKIGMQKPDTFQIRAEVEVDYGPAGDIPMVRDAEVRA